MSKEIKTMAELVEDAGQSLIPFRQSDVVEVTITSITKNKILVDVRGLCLGFIPEREFSYDFEELKVGDKVLAYVLSLENDEGFVVLSLKRADRERIWRTLQEKMDSGELLSVKITQANRGGLIVQFGDVEGFLPVSQLSTAHYPRVSGGDKDMILSKLNEIVSQTLRVKVISFDRNANKLIFSEKAAGDVLQEEKALQFKVGQHVKGKITGIVDFGVFVNLGEFEGLVHISEISWERVDDPRKLFTAGQEVEVVVIGIENGRVSLSIKRLNPDPWNAEAGKLKAGEDVKGEITRVTPFGIFVKLSDRLEGIVQVSEISDDKPVKEGETHDFKILSIEPESRKLTLSLKQAGTKTSVKSEKVEKAEKPTETKKPSKATKPKKTDTKAKTK
ncbi:MAG: S1 RNA-binding domain-containing protein [bacterium]|nr:S1 RNA-binding domain-containing protein [bacterium]